MRITLLALALAACTPDKGDNEAGRQRQPGGAEVVCAPVGCTGDRCQAGDGLLGCGSVDDAGATLQAWYEHRGEVWECAGTNCMAAADRALTWCGCI